MASPGHWVGMDGAGGGAITPVLRVTPEGERRYISLGLLTALFQLIQSCTGRRGPWRLKAEKPVKWNLTRNQSPHIVGINIKQKRTLSFKLWPILASRNEIKLSLDNT